MSIDMYQENILDHYQNPRNYGEIDKPTVNVSDSNPLCGDKLELDLIVDGRGNISEVKFHGKGCAISIASMSMLTERLKGKKIEKVKKLTKKEILEMLNIPISAARIKCALLSLKVFKLGYFEYKKDLN